jgi:hypothetical protein
VLILANLAKFNGDAAHADRIFIKINAAGRCFYRLLLLENGQVMLSSFASDRLPVISDNITEVNSTATPLWLLTGISDADVWESPDNTFL